tara:strand:- start:93788 stop:94984 length:1197 start_codon:yes stop_codon:yes gene_type:complete
MADPPARLLDMTRSLRRAARMATGVDRVERAYLDHLLQQDAPIFGLARTALGYVLLDRDGMRAFLDRLDGRASWGPSDVLSRLPRRRNVTLTRAESDLRRFAIARCLPFGLPRVLRRHLPQGFSYLNVGHSNLTDRVLGAVKRASGRVTVLVHDVIPLEHPEFQRPGTVVPFKGKIDRISAMADLVIYNSHDTKMRSEAQMPGRVPTAVVAHLGVTPPQPDTGQLPPGLPPAAPYFVTVGTIEPRKNHSFLLDVWHGLGPQAPPLLICGSRGWNNETVFDRLDRLPPGGPVREVPGLSDPALAALVQGATGLVFPSHSEGFGLPPVEALTLGTRVLCNDLQVLKEILGNKAVYASVSDTYLWIKTIESWAKNPPDARDARKFVAPTWADHFNTVLRLT